jgi:hypothetical protein
MLAALFATVAMLTLASLAAAGGYLGDSVQRQTVSQLTTTFGAKTVSSQPSRRR